MKKLRKTSLPSLQSNSGPQRLLTVNFQMLQKCNVFPSDCMTFTHLTIYTEDSVRLSTGRRRPSVCFAGGEGLLFNSKQWYRYHPNPVPSAQLFASPKSQSIDLENIVAGERDPAGRRGMLNLRFRSSIVPLPVSLFIGHTALIPQ